MCKWKRCSLAVPMPFFKLIMQAMSQWQVDLLFGLSQQEFCLCPADVMAPRRAASDAAPGERKSRRTRAGQVRSVTLSDGSRSVVKKVWNDSC